MTQIRVVVQSNRKDADDVISDLNEQAQRVRRTDGCLQFEYFRSTDIAEDLLLLGLWESVEAFDAFWQEHPESAFALEEPRLLQAPYHYGSPVLPRRHGQNGVEFYRHTYFQQEGGVWIPTGDGERVETLRWPSYTGVRIINQGTSDPENPGDRSRYTNDTRQEPGCIQFEQFRSVEFPVHIVNMELWTDPGIYDYHFLNRILQMQSGTVTRPAGPRTPIPRVNGANGFEFYQHTYYSLVGGIWQPESERERMVTVRWP